MAFGDQDLAIFFADGSPALLDDGGEVMGHFNVPESLEDFGGARSGEIAGHPNFEHATTDAIKRGTKLTIEGTKYEVRYVRKSGDGKVSVAELKNA